jgi:hypothetical protein
MPTNAFVTIMDSSGSGGKLKVIDYEPVEDKAMSADRTVEGGWDVSMGSIYEEHNYVVKVYNPENLAGYIDFDELKRLYRLNNPNGSPSNILTLTDHFGVNHQVMFVGKLRKRPVGYILEGAGAVYYIPVQLLFLT